MTRSGGWSRPHPLPAVQGRPWPTVVVAGFLALALPSGGAGQEAGATLAGKVVGPDGETPVPDVTVTVEGLAFSVRTDSTGGFRLMNLPPGQDTLRVTHLGVGQNRVPVELTAGDTTRVTMTVQRTLFEIADLTVTVEGDRATIIPEFERRRRAGFGHYITPEEIRERNAIDVSDHLWGIPGIRRESGLFEDAVTMRSPFGRGKCYPAVYWNGNPMPNMRVDDFIPEDVLAIEVYTRPVQMPVRFKNPFTACGAIVVWTK